MLTLLIDADIIAYKIASACEVVTDWGDGVFTLHSDIKEASTQLDSYLTNLKDKLGAHSMLMCLTHPDNFRKCVLPSYKENRKSVRKPLVLKALRQYIEKTYNTYIRPGLEADDCLGILSTSAGSKAGDEQRVIVSIDKDLRTIPGFLYDPSKPEEGIVEVSENEADYNHMYQTLVGDSTDGYKGCPGIGPKNAERILNECPEDWWSGVVKAFKKAGFGEEEALTQARVSRILRATDYNFETKKPILWSPTITKQTKASTT